MFNGGGGSESVTPVTCINPERWVYNSFRTLKCAVFEPCVLY